AAMHNLTSGQGYQDLELDFTGCTATYGGPILAIASQTKRYQIGGLDVDLILPKDERLNRLFLNANWAHLIDPRRYDPGNYRGYAQIPVMQFRTGQDQYEAVTLVTEKILSVLSAFDTRQSVIPQKKRGPPATGKGTPAMVRLPPDA